MNVVALIIWCTTAAGGLVFLVVADRRRPRLAGVPLPLACPCR